jgi:hypothetical protein
MILTELSVRSTWSGRTADSFLPMAVPAFFEPLFGSFTDRFGARFVAFGCFVSDLVWTNRRQMRLGERETKHPKATKRAPNLSVKLPH